MKSLKSIKQIFQPRPKNVHKRQLGHILIIAGSKNMPGAGLLSAKAAFRAGAGLITIAYPRILSVVYQKTVPEALHLPLPQTPAGSISNKALPEIIKGSAKVDLIAMGPGLSRQKQTESFIVRLVSKVRQPLIIDADALNALADSKKVTKILQERRALTILTPHEGEMSRLTGLNSQSIRKDRKGVVRKFSNLWKAIVVLKGYQTLVATPDNKFFINKTGGPGLATAGSGDVLTGIMAVITSQHLQKPFTATAAAVYVHGLAGDLASKDLGERSVQASDLIDYLPEAILKIQKS